jgi:hypothetical protein
LKPSGWCGEDGNETGNGKFALLPFEFDEGDPDIPIKSASVSPLASVLGWNMLGPVVLLHLDCSCLPAEENPAENEEDRSEGLVRKDASEDELKSKKEVSPPWRGGSGVDLTFDAGCCEGSSENLTFKEPDSLSFPPLPFNPPPLDLFSWDVVNSAGIGSLDDWSTNIPLSSGWTSVSFLICARVSSLGAWDAFHPLAGDAACTLSCGWGSGTDESVDKGGICGSIDGIDWGYDIESSSICKLDSPSLRCSIA